jgi:hypothetical protein
MIGAILTLFSGGLGGLLRFVPELFKMFTEKADREHEFRMTQLQLQIDQARATQQIDLVHAQGDEASHAAEMQAYIEALKPPAPSGVKWVDALNASVRPVITYWWMLLLTLYKAIVFVIASIEVYVALQTVKTMADTFIDKVWTDQDAAILSMILGFWFVDRAIRKYRGN